MLFIEKTTLTILYDPWDAVQERGSMAPSQLLPSATFTFTSLFWPIQYTGPLEFRRKQKSNIDPLDREKMIKHQLVLAPFLILDYKLFWLESGGIGTLTG